jgi:hypothetical protein
MLLASGRDAQGLRQRASPRGLLGDLSGLYPGLLRIESHFARRTECIDGFGWAKQEGGGGAFGLETVAGEKQIARSGRERRLGIRAQYLAAHAGEDQAHGFFLGVGDG